jgi:hypothetical protein
MGVYEHATEFAGKRVVEWEPGTVIARPEETAYRITLPYEEADAGKTWEEKFKDFLSEPASARAYGIIAGTWGGTSPLGDSSEVVRKIVEARDRLQNLRALFVGDIISEEWEISWIEQSDMSPLFTAYPALEHFRVRGGTNLRLGPIRHDHLTTLVVESGGLDVSVVRDITASELPELGHLELWLGEEGYGANTEIVDLAPIFGGKLFPKLSYLGLRDSELTDAIAATVAHSPLLERLRVLDLSLGTLSDDGAAALLASPAVARLEFLDVHHHYCSDQVVRKLEALGIRVDASDPQTEEEYDGQTQRYIAVSE